MQRMVSVSVSPFFVLEVLSLTCTTDPPRRCKHMDQKLENQMMALKDNVRNAAMHV